MQTAHTRIYDAVSTVRIRPGTFSACFHFCVSMSSLLFGPSFSEDVISRFLRAGFTVEQSHGNGTITASINTRAGPVCFTALIRQYRSKHSINGGHVERVQWSWPPAYRHIAIPDYDKKWLRELNNQNYGETLAICNMLLECMGDTIISFK